MCLEAGTSLSEERLLKNIVEAFPVLLFKMQLPDKSRKYMEIFEATGIKNGEVPEPRFSNTWWIIMSVTARAGLPKWQAVTGARGIFPRLLPKSF
jgi:hypothetical protein